MTFEVGQVWKTRGGFEVEIKSTTYPNEQFPIFGVLINNDARVREAGRTFSSCGLASEVPGPFDLMQLDSGKDSKIVPSEILLESIHEAGEEVMEDEKTVTENTVDPIRQYFLDSLVMKALEQAIKTDNSVSYYRNDVLAAIELRDSLK